MSSTCYLIKRKKVTQRMKWISFCPLDAYFKKKKWKNQFSLILFQLCQTSCLNVSRKQSRSVNWKFPRTKVTLLIWRIIISVKIIKVETNFSLTATNKINFHANWRAIKAMNKKESWIIDYKYFNCESMTLCLRTEEGKYKKADMQQEN